jgi:hypothetical protein
MYRTAARHEPAPAGLDAPSETLTTPDRVFLSANRDIIGRMGAGN